MGSFIGGIISSALSSAVTKIIIGVLGIGIAYMAGNMRGTQRAMTECALAAEKARYAALQRDLKIQEEATSLVARERAAAATLMAENDRKVADYEQALKKRRDHCRATRDDVRRMRSLGGAR